MNDYFYLIKAVTFNCDNDYYILFQDFKSAEEYVEKETASLDKFDYEDIPIYRIPAFNFNDAIVDRLTEEY